MFQKISRTVWVLSLISFCNDISSEMLYPVLPLFFTQIGYNSAFIGIIEGITECVAGFAKMGLGKLSDQFQTRLPFIQIGYGLSVLSRPIVGFSTSIYLILTGRSMDRIGKGIRTSARDALLADESTPSTKAEVFGFHRSVDTFGAVIGPLIALIYLHYYPKQYQHVFLITIIPGALTFLLTFLLKEKKKDSPISAPKEKLKPWYQYFLFYKEAPPPYLHFVLIILLFSLFNSSDLFLLLRATELGVSPQGTVAMYVLFNLSYALIAYPVGKITNRFGALTLLSIGLLIYASTYFVFAQFSVGMKEVWPIYLSFIFYGLYYALTQGTIKVLLLQKVDSSQKASAIGFYEGLNSFGLLIANALTGYLWYRYGSSNALLIIAIVVVLISVILLVNRKKYNTI
jgi:MFS family permease